jgi:hypothetical protein
MIMDAVPFEKKDCNFSKERTAWANWPLNLPPGAKATRVADLYEQYAPPVESTTRELVRIEEDAPAGEVRRCREIWTVTKTQQIRLVYCVKTYAFSSGATRSRKFGLGTLALGVGLTIAFPPLGLAHLATAGAVAIGTAAGSATIGIGGGALAFPGEREKRKLKTEEIHIHETLEEPRTYKRTEPGPWRACRGIDSTHGECREYGAS